MIRILVAAAVAALAAQFSSAALASTVQYDLTLTPTAGSIGGTGYFDVVTPVNGSGANDITALSISIDGQTFNLGDALGTATATFADGVLTGLNYAGALLNGWNLDLLGTGGLTYRFADLGVNFAGATGTISAVDPPSPTPLPSSIVLFATGLLGFVLLSRRGKRTASSAV
jgi:hypothetical protein